MLLKEIAKILIVIVFKLEDVKKLALKK